MAKARMGSLIPFSVCRGLLMNGGLHWSQFKPQVLLGRAWMSSLKQPKTTPSQTFYGAEGQTAPEKFDGGDYDEEKNQEYEDKAEQKTIQYRRLKKVLSTGMFVSVLAYVGYSRRNKRDELANNLKHVKFLNDDGLFKGSERQFCLYEMPETGTRVVLPASIVKDGTIAKIKNFKIKEDDIIVASFPKAGTTWLQEIVYLINNGLNFEAASKQVMESRFPFLEYPYPGLSSIEKMPAPRLIKTHLPYDFLPNTINNAKIIYIVRNPKDTVVSYYHFSRMFALSSFSGSFFDFLAKFEKDEIPYCPYFDHVAGYSKRKEDPKVLVVTYEELTMDPEEVIQRIANFLGKPLSREEVRQLAEHTSFENMSKNASVNYSHWDEIGFRNEGESKFMRKGKIGDWKNYLGTEENAKFNEWIEAEGKEKFPFVYEHGYGTKPK